MSVYKKCLIIFGIVVVLLTSWAFMSFPDPDVSMNRYYSWLMNILIISMTGEMYVVLSVAMTILFLTNKNNTDSRKIFYCVILSVICLSISVGVYMLRYYGYILITSGCYVTLFFLWVFFYFLFRAYVYILHRE
ncbi:hypothetical protein G3C52_004716 [Salmonella enterica]|nr:hypothetical protein [Salmonella enterica]EBR8648640.1 hypothetical protein [Salmonella enterica subsp. enterica serovar Muenchen]EBJ1787253.1 hypothetical protein [Salmonella enterica]EBM1352073.1 hypothetical protein [Salmonella enterica]EBM3133232.1 hypothetical protein [Salmonella enterica]